MCSRPSYSQYSPSICSLEQIRCWATMYSYIEGGTCYECFMGCCFQVQFLLMWHGVLHHVPNKHVWASRCREHEPLDDIGQEKPWIKQGNLNCYALGVSGSAAHLVTILDKHWLRDIKITFRYVSTVMQILFSMFYTVFFLYCYRDLSVSVRITANKIFNNSLTYTQWCVVQ